MVGHDGHGVVEPYDLTHTLDGLGRSIIEALHTAAKDGRLCKGRDLHARRPNVDAIDGRSVDLRRRIQPLGWGTDELEIPRSLEHHGFGDRHVGCIGDKIAIFGVSSCRLVKHFAKSRCCRAFGWNFFGAIFGMIRLSDHAARSMM